MAWFLFHPEKLTVSIPTPITYHPASNTNLQPCLNPLKSSPGKKLNNYSLKQVVGNHTLFNNLDGGHLSLFGGLSNRRQLVSRSFVGVGYIEFDVLACGFGGVSPNQDGI